MIFGAERNCVDFCCRLSNSRILGADYYFAGFWLQTVKFSVGCRTGTSNQFYTGQDNPVNDKVILCRRVFVDKAKGIALVDDDFIQFGIVCFQLQLGVVRWRQQKRNAIAQICRHKDFHVGICI